MQVGDKVQFEFGPKREKKEGVVVKLFPKTALLKVDFPKHKAKTVKRKIHQLG